jgi:hypothetical protein
MYNITTTITSTTIISIMGSVIECRVLQIHSLYLPYFDTLPFYHIPFISLFRPTWILLYPPRHSLLLVCLALLKFLFKFYFLFPCLWMFLVLLFPVLHGYLVKQWRFQPGLFDTEAKCFATSPPSSYCWLVRTSEFYSLLPQFKYLSEAICPNRGAHWVKKANFWNITPCGTAYIKFSGKHAAFIFKYLLPRAMRQQFSPRYYY